MTQLFIFFIHYIKCRAIGLVLSPFEIRSRAYNLVWPNCDSLFGYFFFFTFIITCNLTSENTFSCISQTKRVENKFQQCNASFSISGGVCILVSTHGTIHCKLFYWTHFDQRYSSSAIKFTDYQSVVCFSHKEKA